MELTTLPDYGWLRYREWQGLSGSLQLTASDDAATPEEPLSLASVKTYLKLDDDPDEDDLLQGMIVAARSQAEILQRRVLVTKQFDLTYDYWPAWRIRLATPVASVDNVRYRDSGGAQHDLVVNTDYVVDLSKQPAEVLPAYSRNWPSFTPWPSSAVLVRFTAGYAPTDPYWRGPGARVKQGMMMLVAAWHGNRMPYAIGQSVIAEYPYAVTALLSYGARPQVI